MKNTKSGQRTDLDTSGREKEEDRRKVPVSVKKPSEKERKTKR